MAQTKGIKIRFEADASPVKSALAQVEKSSKNLTKQLKDIDKLLEMDPTNVTLLAQKQDILHTLLSAWLQIHHRSAAFLHGPWIWRFQEHWQEYV